MFTDNQTIKNSKHYLLCQIENTKNNVICNKDLKIIYDV